ncbi:glycine zipper family protein [Methylomicrobium lacus]|uniref:glycine zipper family protein n=1 Tax=Methylomicrobium lacus TaxID=136992 RepID=UPI0035A875F0
MKIFSILVIAIWAITHLSGCAGMSDTQQRTVTGGLGGAAGGAIIGAIAGNAGMGAAIGAGAGVVGGYLYGKHKESEQRAYEQGRRDAQR